MQDTILDTLLGAFVGDPLYRWLYPNPTLRPIALRDHLAFMLDLASRRGRIETTARGRAVAVWTDPGVTLLDDPAPFLDLLTRWAPARVDAASAAMADCAPHEPDDAAVLHLLAVTPETQGQGLATTLLRSGLRTHDSAGHPTALLSSNPRNLSLYRRCGFAPTAEIPVALAGPTLIPMVRHPSPVAPDTTTAVG